MNKIELKEQLNQAAKNNTLMTPKHDPNELHNTYSSYRTVLSFELASKLDTFINNQEYDIEEYENLNYPGNKYVVIKPHDSGFIPASGILPNDDFAAHTCDCIVAASGTYQGWHMFGEQYQNIENKINSGKLTKL